MDPEFLKQLPTLGVGGVLAAMIFYFYQRAMTEFTAQTKEQTTTLMQLVRDNVAATTLHTAAITALTLTIEALHRRDDRIEDALRKLGQTFPHRGSER